MKHRDNIESWDEMNVEFIKGHEQFKILMRKILDRQGSGDMRMSYSGLWELIEALELNEFILDNTDGKGRVIGA